MATPLATAFVRIRPDTATFKRDTDAAIGRAKLGDSGKRAGSTFMAGFRGAVAGVGSVLAAAFAVKAGFDMFSGFVGDAREAQRVSRITAAAIKATGGAANVTAGQVATLANKLMLLTGVDDETIKAGQNMLLTFRNVRNEAGKGNDVFSRASKDLLDMASALHGGDVSSESLRKTAIQLGKALNDPVLGLQSMRRMGVSFTKEQQKMIAGWVQHGQLVRAQKFILKELEREFGGTAAAAADPMTRLRTMIGEVGESIGTWLLGPLTRAVNFISSTAVPAISRWWKAAGPRVGAGWDQFLAIVRVVAAEVATHLWPVLVKVGAVLVQVGRATAPAWRDLWTFVKQLWQAVLSLWVAFKPIVGPLLKAALVVLIVSFRTLAFLLSHLVGPAIMGLATAIKNFMNWGKTAVNAVVAGFRWLVGRLLGFFGSIVHGAATAFGWIPGLGGKLRAADKAFQNFRDRVNSALGGINGRTVNVGVKFATVGVGPYAGKVTGARGAFVTTGTTPTADDVLARVSRGELIVPANLVKAGAVDHLRGRIPGFASGGLAVRASTPSAGAIGRTLMASIDQLAKAFAKGILLAQRSGGSGGYGVSPKGPLQAYARALLKARGWGDQWGAFNALVMGESGWRVNATNPSSGAYGIPQALPASKMASAGADWRTSGYTQLRWMMGYIASVYGNPMAAYGMWVSRSPHWYGRGGPISEPILGVGAHTGRAYGFHQGETVAPRGGVAGDLGPLLARLDRLIAAAERAPARTGGVLAEALNRSGRRAAYGGMWG